MGRRGDAWWEEKMHVARDGPVAGGMLWATSVGAERKTRWIVAAVGFAVAGSCEPASLRGVRGSALAEREY